MKFSTEIHFIFFCLSIGSIVRIKEISFFHLIKITNFISCFFPNIIQLINLMNQLEAQRHGVCLHLSFLAYVYSNQPTQFSCSSNQYVWFFLWSRDMIMEQVKQTFRFFISPYVSFSYSLSILMATSPPQSISFTGNISFLGFIKLTKERMGIYVVLFSRFHHCEKCGTFVLQISSSSQTI